MSLIQVNYGAMDAGVSSIRGTHTRLQGMFEDLQAQVGQLLPTWDGTARESWLTVQQRWNTLNNELNEALHRMGDGVNTANANFQGAERANTSGWGG